MQKVDLGRHQVNKTLTQFACFVICLISTQRVIEDMQYNKFLINSDMKLYMTFCMMR